MARVRPLRKATTPIAGESARGLFCRALGDHGVPLSFNVLRRLGGQHRNRVTISEDPYIDFEEMARILRVDVAEIEQRRYQPLGEKRYSFFGLELPSLAIEKKVRRFSPASLALSPHIRAIWELRDLPFCAESWEMLVEHCVCRTRQGWIRLNGVHRCDDCGRPLANAPTHSVPKELRLGLSLAAGLANPLVEKREDAFAMLPPPLRGVDRNTLFKCILRLRRALAGDDADWLEDLTALHDACAALLAWPVGLAALRPASSAKPTVWTTAIAGYKALVPSSSTERRRMTRVTLRTNEETTKEDAKSHVPEAPRIGIRPAYELARLTPETLLAGRARGHLARYERLRGGKLVVAFDPDDVERFANEYRARISAETIGYGLGIGRRAVQEISACGHMTASGLSMRDDEVWFADGDVLNFEARMRAARRPSVEEPVRLKDALLLVHGRAKPWGAIVGGMLAGDLPFTIEDDTRKLFDAVRLEGNEAASMSTMMSKPALDRPVTDRVAQREALEILNAKITCRALDGLASSGINPITYSLGDVEGLSQSGVSVLEVAYRTGRSVSVAYHAIRRANIAAVADSLWDRRQVRKRIAGFAA